MRIRRRLVLVVGALSMGALLALGPPGGAAAERPVAPRATASTTCTQAQTLASTSHQAVGPHLTATQKTSYSATLAGVVGQACAGTITCESAENIVATLRSIRGASLPPELEAQVRALEDALLQLLCSS